MNENDIEQNLIDLLVEQGYKYFYGPAIAPYANNPQRETFASVVLENHLKESLERLNPDIPELARQKAYQHIINLGSSDLMTNNEKFHTFLTDGITVEYFKDGNTKGITVKLLDLENITNNSFWVVNQFVIKENNNEKRLDVVIFVNGLPLVIAELKSATDEKATLERAFTQIQNYKNAVPHIFYYNALCIISDGIDARVGSVSAPFSRYCAWKRPEKEENGIFPEMHIMAKKMLDKEVLLRLIRYNTVFEQEEKKDEKTGLTSVVKVKKIAAYHQYYAVQKAVQETLRATNPQTGDKKIGIMRHTQGSGKSLSMVFYTGQIVVHPAMTNPTIVVVTDRNDLDDQLFSTFANCKQLLRQTPIKAENREHLKELLKVAGGGVVFTTIQKFMPSEGNVYDTLSERSNIVVIADEAHRSHYGFRGREVETEDGSEIRYGNAKYLRDALPNASFIAFTGTPIEHEDRSTRNVFGNEIDIYDIKQAVDDGATVPISYESRLVKIIHNQEVVNKIDYAIDEIEGATPAQKERAKKKNAQLDTIVGHPDRLKDIANDIVQHFEARQKIFEGKAMVVCMTRQIAVNLYQEIVSIRPDWHNDELMKGAIKVVMTSSSDDPESFQPHHTNKEDRKKLALRFKDPNDKLQMVIVQSMWLTGFDVPCLHTMYIDKRMQGANLMQAIARVNRVYKDKPGGLIVDYIGIGQDLRNAMAVYTASGGQGEVVLDIADVIKEMKTKYEIVAQMFHGFDYKHYFTANNNEKLHILLDAINFILQNETLKNRFLTEVTALSKLFAMAVPSSESEQIRDEVAFFQAIKARLNKFTPSGGKSNKEVETAIRQIVDEALISDGVVDIFQVTGLTPQTLDILSEEFLLKVENMKQKNLAFELLRKLLNDEIKIRKRKNLTQGKKFSEMLESVINKYRNNQIDTVQVIHELSEIAREMKLEDKKAEDIGLSQEEYAFYSILAQNESTKFLEDHTMKELIHVIVETIRKNATIDWEKREDVRAKLRLTVRKILMRYGYPPDLARIEADKVLEQSELLASELTRG
ncbi:MAG: type I restriction endonuclease subunit R [Candidatus Absconditabacterales bacterium]|nr:type I restriction endonuclease subunit R [Candidatus Absconditabacterales bacterium]